MHFQWKFASKTLCQQCPKILATSILFLLVFFAGGPAHAQSTRPCDILSSSSTPCVAAYSTVRALYSGYTGSLYQVQRQSDSAIASIGQLSDGYANAATQDAFCANTTCTINLIFDQSPSGNNLTPAPAGGQVHTPDVAASATALPVTAGGHKVYGIFVSPGVGYRNDSANNTATGQGPQGVYMVATGVNLNNRCCFDFGNAEKSNNDEGPGTMDALNIIIGNNNVPLVGLDLENGIFGGFGNNAANLFVTAAGTNDGSKYFQLYAGNAQSGTLATGGPQSLPALAPQIGPGTVGAYSPMQQRGAIVLGIGGDNSNAATGEFFEGAMTAGSAVPTPTTLGQVQSNVVSAGYAGPPTGLVDGQTYLFQNQASGMLLDNDCDGCSGSPTSGQPVIQYPASGSPAQEWTLHSQGNGYYTMVNVASGMCLDDPYGNGTPSRDLPQKQGDSTMLWQLPCNGLIPQNWKFIPQGDGSFVIQNEGSTFGSGGTSMVIDDYNGESQADLQMWLYYANGLSAQNWYASLAPTSTAAPSGTIADGHVYTFTNQASGMSLDNDCDGCSGTPASGQEVIQYNVNGVPAQQWTLHSQGSGYFSLVSVQSGLCLDDPYGNGTPSRALPQQPGSSTMLWQVSCNGNPAQNWRFVLQSNGNYVIQNEAATANNGSRTAMVIDDYNGQSTAGLQMWLYTANSQTPQNWRVDLQR